MKGMVFVVTCLALATSVAFAQDGADRGDEMGGHKATNDYGTVIGIDLGTTYSW